MALPVISKPCRSEDDDVLRPLSRNLPSTPHRKTVSVLDAIKNHPEKEHIIKEMNKEKLEDERAEKLMIRAACSFLIDNFGSYPPPKRQLEMAIDIVETFPHRACQSGKGYELYYCPGAGKGFITNRMREIYRRYDKSQKKYKARTLVITEDQEDDINDDEVQRLKVKASHTVSTERNFKEIADAMAATFNNRQKWIKKGSPSLREILSDYPRYVDTPDLISIDFKRLYPDCCQTSVEIENEWAKKIITYCQTNGRCPDVVGNLDLETQYDPNQATLKMIRCIVTLLPTMGRYRVSTSDAMKCIIEEVPIGTSLEEYLSSDNNQRTQPYILNIKPSNFFIIMEKNAVIVNSKFLSVAFDLLFKSFFVFNVKYPPQTQVAFNSIQNFMYTIDCTVTSKALRIWSEIVKY
ncbi:uncharacterized protein LOC126828024 [Patella vulgata]|nr:uncharacterized protein LOC126828024 [Patella vulgata]